MRVLIAYDGSTYSDAALEDMLRAGLPGETTALVVSVADALMMPSASIYESAGSAMIPRRVASAIAQAQSTAMQAFREAKDDSERAALKLRSYFPGWDVGAEALSGTPFQELLQKAELWRPNLIVVGSQGRSALGRFFLGSVSKKIAAEAHSSVRVARRGAVKADDMPPRVVIGIDGSAGAERAVREVGRRVWPEGTKVRIIAVDEGVSLARIAHVQPTAAALIRDSNEEPSLRTRAMVEWAESELSAIGLQASVDIISGHPQQILIEEASRWEADSIFVGSRGMSDGDSGEGRRLGTVATALVTNATCSVEIVR